MKPPASDLSNSCRAVLSADVRDGSIATEMGSPRDVRLSPDSGGIADIPALRICANFRHAR
jgi:hypothetical protein